MHLLEQAELISGTLEENADAEHSLSLEGVMESRRHCAYNQTRECFLGLEVTATDLSSAKLKNLISTFAPKSGEGLWMTPFRGIPASSTGAPLDLIYLDEDCCVIDIVESFPTFQVSPTSPLAASVLALPAHSIYSSQTLAGDQLVLCVAKEMEANLERLSKASRGAATIQTAVLLREKPLWSGGPGLLELGDRSKDVGNECPKAQRMHEMSLVEPGKKNYTPPKNWLERWWSPDPRKAPRETTSELAAYYWNGAAPEAHNIRDISSTGLYVVTEERWYPGTLVLMTLQKTDSGEKIAERTISVQSRAVRWGNDGVGLQFVLENDQKLPRGKGSVVNGVDKKELDRFLQQLWKGKS
jgi:hypothetical protein